MPNPIDANKTIKFCPYCGAECYRRGVVFDGHYNWTRLGRFIVTCPEGHISEVYWPDEDHDEGCECELHDKEEE